MAITFHTCCSLLLVLFTLLEFGACDNRFKNVKFCPANAQEWENRAKNKSCQEPTPDYMCAAIENHPEMFGEICTIVGLSSTGKAIPSFGLSSGEYLFFGKRQTSISFLKSI